MLIALGALLAIVVLMDAIRTTINLSEQRGPIARTVLRAGRAIARRVPRRWRASAGMVITIAVVASWTLGLWLAWTIALSDPSITLIDTTTGEERSGLANVYVAGFAIFTLGTGDLAAAEETGRLVTVVASGTGLFTVTMEVTYLVSLTSAAAGERRTARRVYAVGDNVGRILRRSWDGSSFKAVGPLLVDLAGELGELAEQHRTFPVLHDVMPSQRALALGPSLLALDDAVEIMHRAVPEEQRLGVLAYAQVTEAMDALLAGLPQDIEPDDPPPPADASGVLRSLGATVATDPALHEERRGRRRALFGLATEEGWEHAAEAAVTVTAS